MSTLGDEPIHPCEIPRERPHGYIDFHYGLTKREEFAKCFLAALMTRERFARADETVLICWAVDYADALLKKLSES